MGLLGGGCAAAAFTRGGCGASLGSAAACRLCRGAPAGRPAAISARPLRIMRPSENCEARGFAAFRCAWGLGSVPGRRRGPGPYDSSGKIDFLWSGSWSGSCRKCADFDRRRLAVGLGRVGGRKDESASDLINHSPPVLLNERPRSSCIRARNDSVTARRGSLLLNLSLPASRDPAATHGRSRPNSRLKVLRAAKRSSCTLRCAEPRRGLTRSQQAPSAACGGP